MNEAGPKCCSQNKLCQFLKSSVGKKFVMGITGLLLAGFVFVHMAGNMLIIFLGPDAYNNYGHGITSNPLYVIISPTLLLIFIIHIITAIVITKDNRSARVIGYESGPTHGDKAATLASRTMMYTGAMTAAFLVTHLITFKYGVVYTRAVEGKEVRDLARLVYEIFQSPGYVAWYVLSLLFVGLHLKHGFAAAFNSLGFWHPRYTPLLKCLAVIYAVTVSAGFISQPLYVYFKMHGGH